MSPLTERSGPGQGHGHSTAAPRSQQCQLSPVGSTLLGTALTAALKPGHLMLPKALKSLLHSVLYPVFFPPQDLPTRGLAVTALVTNIAEQLIQHHSVFKPTHPPGQQRLES